MTWGLFEQFSGLHREHRGIRSWSSLSFSIFLNLHQASTFIRFLIWRLNAATFTIQIVYSYQGERLRVCKSISEPFRVVERLDAMNEIEGGFFDNARAEGDDPRLELKFRRLTTFVLPEYGRALIESDVFGEVGFGPEGNL